MSTPQNLELKVEGGRKEGRKVGRRKEASGNFEWKEERMGGRDGEGGEGGRKVGRKEGSKWMLWNILCPVSMLGVGDAFSS